VTVDTPPDAPVAPNPSARSGTWSRDYDDILPGSAPGKGRASTSEAPVATKESKGLRGRGRRPAKPEAAPSEDFFGDAIPPPPPPPPSEVQPEVQAPEVEVQEEKKGRFSARARKSPRNFGSRSRG